MSMEVECQCGEVFVGVAAYRQHHQGGRCAHWATPKSDPVSHPEHYTSDPSGVECIQITRHRNFNIGNAIKYLWRSGLKNTAATTEDLRKAVWYIEDEIARIEGQGSR